MNKKHHGYFHDACSKVKYQGYIPGINKHENWFLAMNKADVQGLMMNDSSKGKINWYYVFVTWIMNVCCGFFLFPPYLAICALLEIEAFFTISFCVFRRSSGELFYPIREMVFLQENAIMCYCLPFQRTPAVPTTPIVLLTPSRVTWGNSDRYIDPIDVELILIPLSVNLIWYINCKGYP